VLKLYFTSMDNLKPAQLKPLLNEHLKGFKE
jgi:hypothetical protein